MQTSPQGRALIEEFEGLRLTSYYDQRGILTIGYGHTGADVFDNMTITQEDADNLLAIDLHQAEMAVYAVKVPLTQNQFDALVSLTYNIGVGAFAHSTLLNLLSDSNYIAAANQFLVWDKTNGQTNQGLLHRRTKERELFLETQ